jgi:membrane associated rhomboid family serine protease
LIGIAASTLSRSPARFMVMYLAAAVAGNVASFFGSPRAVSLGASGAVFGIGGALAMYFYRNRCLAVLVLVALDV